MADDEKVLRSSDIAYDNSLDVFQVPVANLGVSDTKNVSFKPSNSYDIEGNIKFRVPPAGNCYLDLREMYLKTLVRIVHGNGQRIPPNPKSIWTETPTETHPPGPSTADKKVAGEEGAETNQPDPATARVNKKAAAEEEETSGLWRVGPVAYLAHSLWDSVEVRFNDCVVHGGQTGYSYRAVLNTLLGENDLTDEELQCGMCIKDTAGHTDDIDLATTANDGFIKRARLMRESRTVELLSKVDCDVLKLNKFLVNGISIDLTLVPTSSAFRLLTANNKYTDYTLEIVDISLEVKMVSPSNQVLVAHQEVMQSSLSRARYFYLKEDLRKFAIPKSSNSFFIEDAFCGKIPNSLVICFVPSDSLSGSMRKNPYSFKHFKLTYLNVSLSGRPSPCGPLSFDFENGKYIKGYKDLYSGKTGPATNDQRITLNEFTRGFSIFRVVLNSQSDSEHFPAIRDGSVRLECRFAEQLQESIVMLAHITMPSSFDVDYTRGIHLG